MPDRLDPHLIRTLRQRKSWSQEHLARAAGLGLRTVQRLETDGSASAETRLAVAAALEVPVQDLQRPAADGAAPAYPAELDDLRPWQHPAILPVLAATSGGVLLTLWLGSGLPERVASHFNAAGQADGFMGRETFVVLHLLLIGLLPLLTWLGLMAAAARGKVNMPHAALWLAPPHRGATLRFLAWHGAAMSVALVLLLGVVFVEVVNANSLQTPRLPMPGSLLSVGAFLLFTLVWVALLYWRFGRRPDAAAGQGAAGS